MTRLKLPAFGRPLREQRERGEHPLNAYVLYDAFWKNRPTDAPCLCIDLDYTHGIYDWSIVAGVPTQILWRSGRRAVRLVAEVARYSPRVSLITPSGRWHTPQSIFYRRRHRRRHPLWTPEFEADYLAREEEFHQALLADLTQDLEPHGG